MSSDLHTKNLPLPGQRVGRVCGPGEFPRDDAGVVLAIVDSKWGSYALVLLDSGKTETLHSTTTVGIGWYVL